MSSSDLIMNPIDFSKQELTIRCKISGTRKLTKNSYDKELYTNVAMWSQLNFNRHIQLVAHV